MASETILTYFPIFMQVTSEIFCSKEIILFCVLVKYYFFYFCFQGVFLKKKKQKNINHKIINLNVFNNIFYYIYIIIFKLNILLIFSIFILFIIS